MIIPFIQYLPLLVAGMAGVLLSHYKQSSLSGGVACGGLIFAAFLAGVTGPPPLMAQLIGDFVPDMYLVRVYSLFLVGIVFSVGMGGLVRGRVGLYCVSASMFALTALMSFCFGILFLVVLLPWFGWHVSPAAALFALVKGEHPVLLTVLGAGGVARGYAFAQRMRREWVGLPDSSTAEEAS